MVFLMETRPLPMSSEEAGLSFTAFPANEGEERAIVVAAIVELMTNVNAIVIYY